MGIRFEWDPNKAAENARKHGVSFAEAETVFYDPLVGTVSDPLHSVDEQRFVAVGLSALRRILVVVYCDRGEVVRIISARPVTRHEKAQYEEDRI